MSPGEKDDEQLGEDVGVADIEIVLERGDGDVAVELFGGVSGCLID